MSIESTAAETQRLRGATKVRRGASGAFTLIELLLVIGIMAILSVVAIPAMGVLSGSGVRSASAELSGLFEQARSYAVAKNCYVFVGVGQADARTVVARAAVSETGGSTLVSPIFISKPIALPNMELRDPSVLLGKVSIPQAASSADKLSSSDIGQMILSYQGRSITAANVLRISPTGQVSVRKDSASRYIQVGLAPAEKADSVDLVLIQVAGLTGNVSVFLP